MPPKLPFYSFFFYFPSSPLSHQIKHVQRRFSTRYSPPPFQDYEMRQIAHILAGPVWEFRFEEERRPGKLGIALCQRC
jgi:hypothetical protein